MVPAVPARPHQALLNQAQALPYQSLPESYQALPDKALAYPFFLFFRLLLLLFLLLLLPLLTSLLAEQNFKRPRHPNYVPEPIRPYQTLPDPTRFCQP
jgi:hypothetical protein